MRGARFRNGEEEGEVDDNVVDHDNDYDGGLSPDDHAAYRLYVSSSPEEMYPSHHSQHLRLNVIRQNLDAIKAEQDKPETQANVQLSELLETDNALYERLHNVPLNVAALAPNTWSNLTKADYHETLELIERYWYALIEFLGNAHLQNEVLVANDRLLTERSRRPCV